MDSDRNINQRWNRVIIREVCSKPNLYSYVKFYRILVLNYCPGLKGKEKCSIRSWVFQQNV